MATATTQQLPQLELFHRMLELPMIELALTKSASTYSRLKDCHQLVNWALTNAESSLTRASCRALPYAKRFETPISYVDHTLCRGLDKIERRVPIVKERPEMILENAYILALQTVRPAISTISYAHEFVSTHAATIKDASWHKMNQILSTHYGEAAVYGFDNTAFVVEMLIDKYFPPIGEEKFPETVSLEEDKLLHTLQTVGRLSNKATRRIFSRVIHQLRTLSKENLKTYLTSLVEFLQLARYLHAINERVHAATSPVPPPSSSSSTSTAASSPSTTSTTVSAAATTPEKEADAADSANN